MTKKQQQQQQQAQVLPEDLGPEETLAAIYAQKRGVSLDQALALIQSLSSKKEDRIQRLQKYLEALKTGTDVFSNLPPNVAQTIAPLVLAQPNSDEDPDIKKTVVLATTLKSLLGDPSQEFQYRLLEKLLDKTLQQQQPQPGTADVLAEKLDQLASALMQQRASSDGSGDLLERLEEIKKLAELLGYKRGDELMERLNNLEKKIESLTGQAPTQPSSPVETVKQILGEVDKVKEVLEAMGYKVEKQALTPLDMERILRQREEELRRKVQLEAEIERERINAVKEIILTALREIGSQFTQALAEAQKEALRYRILQKLQEGAQSASQGGVEGGSPTG
ncbi:MAG: hypothetical protein QXV17_02715 [Candidatus Micrarchaeaceae archaeon]|uniref:hypothetical protein n=1 Tax=Metallosphaera sp. TaxID=2020860 RepID=UPI003167EE40